MRILANQTGVQAPDADYPKGRIVNNQTIINEEVNGDIINLFQKLVDLAGISENGNPDNETNGYQLLQAFAAYVRTLASSESAPGVVERATQSEVNGGSDDARYVTPLKLRSTTFITAQIPNLAAGKITSGTFAAARLPQATESAIGAAEIATQTEVNTGTDDERFITPLKLQNKTASVSAKGIVELATSAETISGTDTERSVTPKGLKDTLDDKLGTLKSKVVEIGDWNMDTTGSVNVTHGLNYDDIIGVRVIIRSDTSAAIVQKRPLNYSISGAVNNGFWTLISGNTFITLFRDASGVFDNTDYNSTSYNRGWIIFDYI